MIVSARSSDFLLAIEYASADTHLSLYDEPILAWAVDPETGNESPIIPGAFPPGPAVPDATKPSWCHLVLSPTQPTRTLLAVVPNGWRGPFSSFLDWLTASHTRKLRGIYFISPMIVAQFAAWQRVNPASCW